MAACRSCYSRKWEGESLREVPQIAAETAAALQFSRRRLQEIFCSCNLRLLFSQSSSSSSFVAIFFFFYSRNLFLLFCDSKEDLGVCLLLRATSRWHRGACGQRALPFTPSIRGELRGDEAQGEGIRIPTRRQRYIPRHLQGMGQDTDWKLRERGILQASTDEKLIRDKQCSGSRLLLHAGIDHKSTHRQASGDRGSEGILQTTCKRSAKGVELLESQRRRRPFLPLLSFHRAHCDGTGSPSASQRHPTRVPR